jgi:xanthine dehydrogenase accessory factor
LFVYGGGHVGRAVAFLGKWLGFRIVIYDDRADYATAEAVPNAHVRLTGPLDEALSATEFTPDTYIVAVTRAYKLDVAFLKRAVDMPTAYIGVMGSRRRVQEVFKALRAEGVPDEQLARLRAPVGLELNAETPEEIAVSVLGEIVMLRRGGSGEPMKATYTRSNPQK